MNVFAASEKRAELALGLSVTALTFACAWLASRALAPAFGELPRLAGVERAERLVLEIARGGSGALSALKLRTLSPEADAPPALALLIAAWARLSLGRLGVLDPLVCSRLPWLIAAALAPPLVYAIVRPSRGRFAAWLAAALLVFQPHWLHATGIASEAAALSGIWLLAILAYLRAEAPCGRPHRRLCWAAGSAIAIGVGFALSLATAWLVALLLLHHAAAHWGSVRRLLRRGRLPVPAALIFAVPLAPLIFILCRPELLSENAITTLRALLAVLTPSVQDALFHGRVVGGASPPGFAYAVTALLWTLPTTLVIASAVGFGAIVQRALARRFASGRLRPGQDDQALGALVVLGVAVTLLAPALVPSPLLVFPPRLELVLPFVTIAAAIGVETAARRAAGARHAWAPGLLIVLMLAWQTLRDRKTNSAAYAAIFGGTERVSRAHLFGVGDGSELAALVPRLESLGSTLAIEAPEVPEGFWPALQRHGRIKASVTRGGSGKALRLERGAARGRALAVVERDGAPLWSLVE